MNNKLLEARKRSGLTPTQVAEKMGKSPQNYYQYEIGKRFPGWDWIESFAEATGQEIIFRPKEKPLPKSVIVAVIMPDGQRVPVPALETAEAIAEHFEWETFEWRRTHWADVLMILACHPKEIRR